MLAQAAEDALIAAVRAAARAQILPRYRRLSPSEIRSKSRRDDLVTEVDLAVESALTAAIADILPGIYVLGEEAASADPELIARATAAETCVIIDPVDGTWNYANGISVFGTILAIQSAGQTVWGLLYDPLMDDWVIARRGGGAWYVRPGQSPRACVLTPPDAARAQAGFMGLALFPEATRADYAHLAATQFDRVMGLRCSCHEYRTMLNGAVGWSVSPAPMPWDHAAGTLAMVECGGHAAFLEDGTLYSASVTDGTLIVARDKETWHQLQETFRTTLPNP